MKRSFRAAMILAIVTSIATPALADKGHGRDKHHRKEYREQRERRDYRDRRWYRDEDERRPRAERRHCPPGLARKEYPCVPPGHARRYYSRGDILRGDYYRIRDYDRYDLEQRRDWDYYRDDDRIYRVDRNTRRILAVINLIDAFSN